MYFSARSTRTYITHLPEIVLYKETKTMNQLDFYFILFFYKNNLNMAHNLNEINGQEYFFLDGTFVV